MYNLDNQFDLTCPGLADPARKISQLARVGLQNALNECNRPRLLIPLSLW